ncbi:acetoin utilization protein AcuC [Aeromicrobium sp. CTD01-1L150]|uniref:acetoin utilization protein AcuC n=1 Tax=Aeromicrobium sp. CTD01-1L150 TaxID=3341830 RepID=UPI0035C21BD8
MTDRACLVFDDRLTAYNFGQSHPMAPVRVELTMSLSRELGILDHLEIVGADPCSEEQLLTVHEAGYVERVRKLSAHPTHSDPTIGLGTEDNPVFAGMHEASALIAGATVEAARRVWTAENKRAINIAGGLHHAMAAQASGFCIYNDVAVAIAWLLDQGAQKVAYVDVDAHHGDGVQQIFYDDPRVLTISVHEGPQSLFPGTGWPTETGGTGAEGSAVNVALPPGTSDAGWLRAFHAVVPQVLREFGPDVLITQHGCDSHMDDPLTNLMLSVDGQLATYKALRDLAEEVAGGRWIITGGGGYAVTDVVPRIWTHLLAVAADRDIDPATPTPEAWRQEVSRLRGTGAPYRMGDGRSAGYRPWELGFDPASWLDRSIQAARVESFPSLGIDPTL